MTLPETSRVSHKGFTLIELVIVLTIVGLMSVLVVPRIVNSLTGAKFKTAARKTAAVLRFAQNEAVKKQSPVAVTVTDGQLKITRKILNPNLTINTWPAVIPDEAETTCDPFPDVVIQVISVSKNGSEDDKDIIWFLPEGHSTGGAVNIQKTDGELYYRVRVEKIAGQVHIDDGSPPETS